MNRVLLEAFVALFAPRRCAACDSVLPVGCEDAFCAVCGALVERVEGPLEGSMCAAFVYGGPMAGAIQRLKFEGRSDLGPVLGRELGRALLPLRGRFDCVAPVPLHLWRRLSRGYDQAALVAAPVARALRIPLDTGLLTRRKATRPQTGLSSSDRARNVRDAFRASGSSAGRRILVIDDVRTTGATLRAAATALRRSGAVSAVGCALAATERHRDSSGDSTV